MCTNKSYWSPKLIERKTWGRKDQMIWGRPIHGFWTKTTRQIALHAISICSQMWKVHWRTNFQFVEAGKVKSTDLLNWVTNIKLKHCLEQYNARFSSGLYIGPGDCVATLFAINNISYHSGRILKLLITVILISYWWQSVW